VLTAERLRSLMAYDPETGIFVRLRHNTSGFRGVSWNSRAGKWKAAIVVRGRTRHLGFFADAAEAGAVYEEAAAREFGEFARV